MTIYNLMKKRRSVRKYRHEAVDDDVIEKLIEAASTAPSAGNKQPWSFLILKNKDLIQQTANLVKSECKNLRDCLKDDFRDNFEEYSKNFWHFKSAPLIIVPICREHTLLANALRNDTCKSLADKIISFGTQSNLVSVSLAIQNILLMAEELSLGACCMTGPLIAENKIQGLLGVPDDWRVVAFIALGYPDEVPETTSRKKTKLIMKWLR